MKRFPKIEELYQIFLKHPLVTTDSRTSVHDSIFFALKGESFNGHDYVSSVLANGAAFCVVDQWNGADSEQLILVENVLQTLQSLAALHRSQFVIPFIGITGSNGKTTTKELCTAVLSTTFKTYATKGNLNNHIGVPLTLLSIPQDAEIAIIEMGANHQNEIAEYCQWAQPDYALINNVGKAHLEGFGDLDGVMKAKGELYDYVIQHDGTIFMNNDLHYLDTMAKGYCKRITYGTQHADYRFLTITDNEFAAVASLNPGTECRIFSQLIGDFNTPNLMAAITMGLHFGINIDVIKKAIEQYTPDNSRSQLIHKGTNKIILDAYNANPSSMQLAIQNLSRSSAPNKVLWIGAMKEMGAEEQKEHLTIVEQIKKHQWKQVILVGKEFKFLSDQFTQFDTAEEAEKFLRNNLPMNATILIKGSRGSKMEVLLQVFDSHS